MSTELQEFDIVLSDYGDGGCGFAVPFDVSSAFGLRGKVRVSGTIDDVPYRGSLTPYGGRHYLGVNRAMRSAIDKDGGDMIHVVMEVEPESQALDMPEDLLWALDFDRQAGAIFESYSFARRQEFIAWLESARKPEIRARRLAQAIQMILESEQAVAS
jgi:hypothetical protein